MSFPSELPTSQWPTTVEALGDIPRGSAVVKPSINVTRNMGSGRAVSRLSRFLARPRGQREGRAGKKIRFHQVCCWHAEASTARAMIWITDRSRAFLAGGFPFLRCHFVQQMKDQIEPEDRKICAPTLIIMAAAERGWQKWRLEYFCTYFSPHINIAMYNNDNISYDPPLSQFDGNSTTRNQC